MPSGKFLIHLLLLLIFGSATIHASPAMESAGVSAVTDQQALNNPEADNTHVLVDASELLLTLADSPLPFVSIADAFPEPTSLVGLIRGPPQILR